MKQIFFDKSQAAVIKVFQSSRALEREICGANHLSNVAVVPKIQKLDQKVAKMSLLPGFLGYQIIEEDLNALVAKFLLDKKSVEDSCCMSIFGEIDMLKKSFASKQEFITELERLESCLKGRQLYPVHGDLQKQNIIIVRGKLGLIDFERFLFAPRELELCNSLFFNDGNCLNVGKIIKLLLPGFIDREMLQLMARFYMLRQVSLGMSMPEAEKRLKRALERVDNLPKKKQGVRIENPRGSFCYI